MGDTLKRSLGKRLSIFAFLAIALATLTPSGEQHLPGSTCLICGEVGGTDAVLNVLLYLPLGIGLAMAGVRARRAIPMMIVMSATIEFVQWRVLAGRDGAIGDVLTNSIGGAAGFLIGSHLGLFLVPSALTGAALLMVWMCAWLGVQFASSFALHPRPTDAKYYGQLARPLGDELPYPGKVLRVSLDAVPLPDWGLPHSHEAFLALDDARGAAIDVLLESRRNPPGFAPIARVLDEHQLEEFMLGAERGDLLFSIRTGAAILRLRPVVFRARSLLVRSTMGRSTGVDTLQLRARYAPPLLSLGVADAGSTREQAMRVSSAAGWRLITPIDTSADGSPISNLLDSAWLFLLVLPAGWWLACACASRPRRGLASCVWPTAVVVSALALGFTIGPAFYHLAPPAWWEVAGVFGGIIVGAAGARSFGERVGTGAWFFAPSHEG